MSIAEATDLLRTPAADPHAGGNGHSTPADTLRVEFGACALSFTPWLGTSKTLTTDQKERAAREFGAEGKSPSAGKKLLDTRHERFRAVTAIKTDTRKEWERVSLPYPDPGVRLIRQESVGPFQDYIDRAKSKLDRAVDALDDVFHDLRDDARQRLGDLYNPADYPATLHGLFGIEVAFPSIDPPDYLRQIRPDVYEAERARVAARFDEAVALAEESFTGELSKLVGHLVDCLTRRGEDGRPKTFKNTTVGNLREFFERFQSLSVRSNPELDRLVETAQTAIANANPGRLRGEPIFRQSVADRLAPVQSALAKLDVLRRRGLAGRVSWITGQSGTGKTTAARLIAAELADDWAVEEIDGADLSMERVRDFEERCRLKPLGMGQHVFIVNEAHALSSRVIRRLNTVFEHPNVQKNSTWIFTTTVDGHESLFEGEIETAPFTSRVSELALSRRNLAEPFAARGLILVTGVLLCNHYPTISQERGSPIDS